MLNKNTIGQDISERNKTYFSVSIATDNGKLRADNQDNYFVNGLKRDSSKPIEAMDINVENSLLAEVCDGMGGESNGELASKIAVDEMDNMFDAVNAVNIDQLEGLANSYVNNANTKICQMLQNSKSSRGGSTFALVYIRDNIVYPFSLGDSRIYLFRNGKLDQISVDHTLAMRKYRANIYTKEEAEASHDSHKLTLFLGVDYQGNGLDAEKYQPFELMTGDKILLCSDGLYDLCSSAEIADVLSNKTTKSASALVDIALKNGGTDNVTCVVISYLETDTKARAEHVKPAKVTDIKFDRTTDENRVNIAEASVVEDKQKEKGTNKLTILLVILVSIAIVLLLAVLMVLLFGSREPEPVDNKPESVISEMEDSSEEESSIEKSYAEALVSSVLNPVESQDISGEASSDIAESSEASDKNTAPKRYGDFQYTIENDTVNIVGYYGEDKTVEIPESIEEKAVTKIGDYAFRDNKSIQTIQFPENNNIEFGEGAFMGCTGLQTLENTSSSLSVIRSKTFENCSSLDGLDISDSQVVMIENGAFNGCKALSWIGLPDSLRTVLANAFKDCTSLESVTLNDYCEYESNAFPTTCYVSGGRNGVG